MPVSSPQFYRQPNSSSTVINGEKYISKYIKENEDLYKKNQLFTRNNNNNNKRNNRQATMKPITHNVYPLCTTAKRIKTLHP
jgi:hypothetical protein